LSWRWLLGSSTSSFFSGGALGRFLLGTYSFFLGTPGSFELLLAHGLLGFLLCAHGSFTLSFHGSFTLSFHGS
jgi:hypothetical protein